ESYAILALTDGTPPLVQLLDADGSVMAFKTFSAGSVHPTPLVFSATTSGNYYVSMQTADAIAGSGLYAVTAMQLAHDPVPGSTATPFSVVAGDGGFGPAVVGTIDMPGDQDWYRLDATAGHSYSVAFNSSSSDPLFPRAVPLARVMDAD